MVSNIADFLAEDMEIGDPPATVQLGKISADVRKDRAIRMVNMSISSHIGSSRIRGKLDVPDDTCIVSQV